MQRFLDQTRREYSLNQRLVVSGLAGVLFVFLIPWLLVRLGPRLDRRLRLPRFCCGAANALGGLLVVPGVALGFWSGYTQIAHARGTPIPLVATKNLLVDGPFRLCRNPMTLGTLVLYTGIGVAVGSFSALAAVFAFGAVLVAYLKLFEERELEARFGQEYRDYRASTPFILPRFFGRQGT